MGYRGQETTLSRKKDYGGAGWEGGEGRRKSDKCMSIWVVTDYETLKVTKTEGMSPKWYSGSSRRDPGVHR